MDFNKVDGKAHRFALRSSVFHSSKLPTSTSRNSEFHSGIHKIIGEQELIIVTQVR